MYKLELDLTDEELELLYEMSHYGDVDGEFQSTSMEILGEKIRTALEELE
jgi:hypothetical protein